MVNVPHGPNVQMRLAAVKFLLRGIGAMNRHGGALTSYLLFERPFTRALIDLGYADTMARDTEVGDFLGL